MDPVAPGREQRFTSVDVDSALQTLLFQASHVTSVSEEVEFGWSETRRQVVASFALRRPQGEESPQTYFVPILTPKKHQLVSVSEVHTPDGSPVRLLAHDEHIELSQEMIRVLLLYVYAEAGDAHSFKEDAAGPSFVMRELINIPIVGPDEAREIFEKHFERDRFITLKGSMRPSLEVDLAELCRTLADRYLIVARVSPKTQGECRVAWTVTDANPARFEPSDLRSRAKMLIGDHPQRVRFSAPHARVTDDYHMRISAPEAHYAFRSRAIWSPDNWRTRADDELKREPVPNSELLDLSAAKDNSAVRNRVRQAHLRGAVPTAHVYVAGGSTTSEAIDVEVVWQEVPLGSIGGPALAAFLTAMLASVLLTARWLGFASDLPATFVAVAFSATVSPAVALMSRSQVRPSLMSRTVTFFLSLTALAFALWWALPLNGNAANALSQWRYAGVGALLTCCTVVIAVVATLRASKAIGNYNSARRAGY